MLSIIMLAFGFTLIGCNNNPDDPDGANEVGDIDVTVGNDATRTVLPVGVQLDRYVVTFQGQNGQAAAAEQTVNGSGGTASAQLQVGNWAVLVTGYEGSTALVKGQKDITIKRGTNSVTVPVNQPNTAGAANGTFNYNLTLPTGSTGTLTLTPVAAGGTTAQTRNINATVNQTISVSPGFYNMQLRLTNGNTIGHYESVHVYPGKVSPYIKTVTADDFQFYTLSGTVGLTLGSGPDPSFIYLYAYADQARLTQIASTTLPTGSGTDPRAWSLNIPQRYATQTVYFTIELVDTFGRALLNTPNSHTVSGNKNDIDLGRVTASGAATVAFTTAWDDDDSVSLSTYAIRTLSKTNSDTATVSVNDSRITSYQWVLDGERIAGATGSSFTINAADTRYTVGVHYLGVEVYLNDAPYSKELRFQVVYNATEEGVVDLPPVAAAVATPPQYTTEPASDTAWANAGWKRATITPNEVHYYKFQSAPGKTYKVQTNAYWNGSSSYYYQPNTADITVTGHRNTYNGTVIFANNNVAYSSPSTVTGDGNTVYIEIKPYGYGWPATGKYAVRVIEQ